MLMIESSTEPSQGVSLIGTKVSPDIELLHRACWGVSAIRQTSSGGPGAWLESALAITRRVVETPISYQASVRVVQPGAVGASIECFGVCTAPEHDPLHEAIRQEFLGGCPNDDLTPALLAGSPSRAFAARRRDLVTPEQWSHASLRAWRAALGLGEFLCVITPLNGGAGRSLVLTADAFAGEDAFEDCHLAALSSLAREIAGAFYERFIRAEERRRKLLDALSPTQRQIAPLLADGLKESLIAARFKRSPHTIHEHVREIYRAWGVQTRDELRMLWAGLLPREWRMAS